MCVVLRVCFCAVVVGVCVCVCVCVCVSVWVLNGYHVQLGFLGTPQGKPRLLGSATFGAPLCE